MKIKLRRNKHNLSHFRVGTCLPGILVPVGLTEVCPGDTFNHQTSAFVRMLPMNAPLLSNAQVRLHSFYVPFRLLWSKWEDFITRSDATITAVPNVSYFDFTGVDDSIIRLADYLGVDVLSYSGDVSVSVLPWCAYNAIYNEWYRDQDLGTLRVVDADDIDVPTLADGGLARPCWQKDYFTAARPWPQKGADVTLPLGDRAPVLFDTSLEGSANAQTVRTYGATGPAISRGAMGVDDNTGSISGAIGGMYATSPTTLPFGGALDLGNTHYTDLTSATAATVNTVRRAFELQRLAERLAQFGSRYPEFLASMGVKSSDARLQRPEYLGGGKFNIAFSEVLQTSEGATTPVGEMRGHAIAPGRTRPYRRFFEEHGYVMTLMSVRPQTLYSSALPRHFLHGLMDAQNDFYTPELERIGQQEIINAEIYVDGLGEDHDIFGYNDRYAEYRHQMSQVCGDLKVGFNLDYWTWARGFDTRPALNNSFVECVPSSRVFADTSSHPIIFGVNHKLIARRMLTKNVIGRIM